MRPGIAGPQLLAGSVGFIEAAFLDQVNDAVRELNEIVLIPDVSRWRYRCRYRWRCRRVNGAVALSATALVLPATAARAGLVSSDLRHYRLVISSPSTPPLHPDTASPALRRPRHGTGRENGSAHTLPGGTQLSIIVRGCSPPCLLDTAAVGRASAWTAAPRGLLSSLAQHDFQLVTYSPPVIVVAHIRKNL